MLFTGGGDVEPRSMNMLMDDIIHLYLSDIPDDDDGVIKENLSWWKTVEMREDS